MTSDSPLRDFLGEVGWYQRRGIGANISRTELRELWKKAPTVLLPPNEFDNYGNFSPYGKEIVGNVEQRIAKFMKIAIIAGGIDNIPSKKFGAIEMIIWNHKLELEKLGHEVVIFNDQNIKAVASEVNNGQFDFVHLNYSEYVSFFSRKSAILATKG